MLDYTRNGSKKQSDLKRNKFSGIGDERFVIYFDIGIKHIQQAKLSGTDRVILDELIFNMPFKTNEINISLEELSNLLNMKKQHIARSINKLVESRIIIKNQDPKDRRRNKYYLSDKIAFRGTYDDWKEFRENNNNVKRLEDQIENSEVLYKEYNAENNIITDNDMNQLHSLILEAAMTNIISNNEEYNNEEIELSEAEIEGQMPISGFNNGDEIKIEFPSGSIERNGKKYKFKGGTFTLKFKQYSGED